MDKTLQLDMDCTEGDVPSSPNETSASGALGIPGRALKLLKLSPSFGNWGSSSSRTNEEDDIFDKIGSFW